MKLDGYYAGIACASGYLACEDDKHYLVVRNLDEWFPKCIENVSKHMAYKSKHNIARDGKPQWVIKARDVVDIPCLSEITEISGFCRAYIEIHGILDLASARNRRGEHFKKPRLRIYGKEDVLELLNINLPAKRKKIQFIKNTVDDIYTGQTCAIYYQSAQEIADILRWIDGDIRNEKIWKKWREIMPF